MCACINMAVRVCLCIDGSHIFRTILCFLIVFLLLFLEQNTNYKAHFTIDNQCK